jgi:hypothetical protein
MAILVLRYQKLGHSMHLVRHTDPGLAPAVDWSCIWRTLADRDLKMSGIDASRRQLQSA